jgi:methylenetetrahydrofolate dehydrogenase (NADP+)/methenyltetrahydrofolate cyclohydrolase
MKILDGAKVAETIYNNIQSRISKMKTKPVLAVILVGNDPASKLYVSIKEKMCLKVGIGIRITNYKLRIMNKANNIKLQKQIIAQIKKLNNDKNITGIIVQLPLPKGLDTNKIIETIDPKKDVDGLNPLNIGKLLIGDKEAIAPPTAAGILELLKYYKINLSGKHIVMVGYGKLVGKPLANMIAVANSDATLTICDKKTKNLPFYTRQADILISATGVGHLIQPDMIKKDAVIIDAGTSTIGGKIVGDVDFEKVKNKASYITPTFGGVGPMTVAKLLENVMK